MTAIASVIEGGVIWMGGDAALTETDSSRLMVTANPKVFRHGNFLMGFCGLTRMGRVLQYSFTPPKHLRRVRVDQYMNTTFVDALRKAFMDAGVATKHDNEETIPADLLVGYRGRLFLIDPSYAVVESSRPYDAIGCGAQVALGALHVTQKSPPRARVISALKAAQEHDSAVRGPFEVLSLEPK